MAEGSGNANPAAGSRCTPEACTLMKILFCFGDACWQTLGQIWIFFVLIYCHFCCHSFLIAIAIRLLQI